IPAISPSDRVKRFALFYGMGTKVHRRVERTVLIYRGSLAPCQPEDQQQEYEDSGNIHATTRIQTVTIEPLQGPQHRPSPAVFIAYSNIKTTSYNKKNLLFRRNAITSSILAGFLALIGPTSPSSLRHNCYRQKHSLHPKVTPRQSGEIIWYALFPEQQSKQGQWLHREWPR